MFLALFIPAVLRGLADQLIPEVVLRAVHIPVPLAHPVAAPSIPLAHPVAAPSIPLAHPVAAPSIPLAHPVAAPSIPLLLDLTTGFRAVMLVATL